jgi:putative sterol carrier protein
MAVSISELMSKIPGAFAKAGAAGPDAIAQFHFSGREAGDWIVEIKSGVASVTQGTHPAPQVTLSADSDVCLQMFAGELDPLQAFLQGKVQFAGDLALAMKLAQMLRG